MKINDYQNAIEQFTPDSALRNRIAEAVLSDAHHVHSRGLARIAAGAAVTLLLAAASTGVVMAASPELRAAVLSFLHISEAEDVPGPNASLNGTPDVSDAVIGEAVKAQYIQLDGTFNMTQDGLLCQTQLDPHSGAAMPAGFWRIENGRAIQADILVNKAEVNLESGGVFYWYERNGGIQVLDPSPELASVTAVPGGPDVVIEQETGGYSKYYLYNIRTGKTRDLFADVESIGKIKRAAFNSDMTVALVNCGEWYYVDITKGTASTLKELTGIGDFSTANLLPDGVVQLIKRTDAPGLGAGYVDCWMYDPAAGRSVKVLDGVREFNEFNEPGPYGVVILGEYCIDVNEDGCVCVLNLRAGTSVPVNGFTYDPEATMIVSPAGDKILYAAFDDSGMMFVTRLGVINLSEGRAIEFDRAKPAELFELKLNWLDNDRVAISGTSLDNLDHEVTSLYIYEF